MFKIRKTTIKTTLLVLLFSLVTSHSFAATYNLPTKTVSGKTLLAHDTLVTNPVLNTDPVIQKPEFMIPSRWNYETFEFQVNSEIKYYTFSNFVKTEARKLFFQAWMKEKELNQLTRMADSLRKEYVSAHDARKNEISEQILNNEKQTILLNPDIQDRFQKARILEAEYWQNASPETKALFQEKIRTFQDSIQRITKNIEKQSSSVADSKQDTLVLYQIPVKQKEIAAAVNNGIIYKIQIGAYKSRKPDWADKAIKKLSLLRKVDTHTDEKGVKVYTTGNLKTWTEAVTLQKQVKQEGIRNPSIVAYENNKSIPVNEARKKNNEL